MVVQKVEAQNKVHWIDRNSLLEICENAQLIESLQQKGHLHQRKCEQRVFFNVAIIG